jgi:hypothetical protein
MSITKKNNEEVKSDVWLMMEGLKAVGVDFEFKVTYKKLTFVSKGYKEEAKPTFECFPNYSPLWLIEEWKRKLKDAKR